MNAFPKVLAAYTSRDPQSAIVFYQIRSARGYRDLQDFFRTRSHWHLVHGWSARMARQYRLARLETGLPTPLYAETALGWAAVPEPQWPLRMTPSEETRFLPKVG